MALYGEPERSRWLAAIEALAPDDEGVGERYAALRAHLTDLAGRAASAPAVVDRGETLDEIIEAGQRADRLSLIGPVLIGSGALLILAGFVAGSFLGSEVGWRLGMLGGLCIIAARPVLFLARLARGATSTLAASDAEASARRAMAEDARRQHAVTLAGSDGAWLSALLRSHAALQFPEAEALT